MTPSQARRAARASVRNGAGAAVEARTTDLVRLRQGDLRAELAGLQGSGDPGWPAAATSRLMSAFTSRSGGRALGAGGAGRCGARPRGSTARLGLSRCHSYASHARMPGHRRKRHSPLQHIMASARHHETARNR